MSRIGKKPIAVPSGVEVKIDGSHITVKGPKGTLEKDIRPEMTASMENGQIVISRPNDESEMKALRSQIDAEDYKLLPISYIAKTYFNKSASWLLQRLNGYQVRGKIYTLNQEQKGIVNQAVKEISNRISALQLA